MGAQGLSQELALRIGMAARVLPDIDPGRLMTVLVDAVKMPLTEQKLETLTVQKLRSAGDGALQNISLPALKEAIDYLWGNIGVEAAEDAAPEPVAYQEGDMPGSIRIAVASNSGQKVNGHFGTCTRFLVYQVSADELRLIEVRRPGKPAEGQEKNAYRADMVRDCDLLYVMSIGGPAAAKVVRADVHPVKVPEGGDAKDVLVRTQETLKSNPPPWLARAMERQA
jgi:nitrogen fixation protein NifX